MCSTLMSGCSVSPETVSLMREVLTGNVRVPHRGTFVFLLTFVHACPLIFPPESWKGLHMFFRCDSVTHHQG